MAAGGDDEPATSIASVAYRVVKSAGGSKRKTSSTADAASDGSSSRRASSPGCSSRVRTALVRRPIVVSNPAVTSSTELASCSNSLRTRPSSSVVPSAANRPVARGPGAVVGHDAAQGVGEPLHVVDPAPAGAPARVEQGDDPGVPVDGIDAEEQPRAPPWGGGRPSTRPDRHRPRPPGGRPAARPQPVIAGRSSSTACGVNARLMRSRARRCSGPSSAIIQLSMISRIGPSVTPSESGTPRPDVSRVSRSRRTTSS